MKVETPDDRISGFVFSSSILFGEYLMYVCQFQTSKQTFVSRIEYEVQYEGGKGIVAQDFLLWWILFIFEEKI